MMEGKHTPAPWRAEPFAGRWNVWPISKRKPNGSAVAYDCTEADARLIAAAPDLLEALRLAVRQNSHDMLLTAEELRQCEAAIAAADGL
jgi:hypothetical protein